MKLKNNKVSRINIAGIIAILITTTLCFVIGVVVFVSKKMNDYKYMTYYNTYLNKYNIAELKYSDLDKKVETVINDYLNTQVILNYSDNRIVATYKELGIIADSKKVLEEIKKDKSDMSFINKIQNSFKLGKNNYYITHTIDENVLNDYITNIKNTYDRGKTEEVLTTDENRNLVYVEGKSALSLDLDSSKKLVLDNLKKDEIAKEINLIYNEEQVESHESYKTIDTKVSSFTTEFNPYISRATNLRTALAYIDGAIIEPGEVFSFYKYAGPYNRNGYVFYYEFVGNGVCQIATTTYNAALLGGLEIVERYQHAEMVPYVAGGLDATVASYSGGWYVDMKFKNTYKYPIYISAYAIGGEAHVDFWSNSNAKEGKTYQTESVKVSSLGYKSYLHVFDSNGQEIEKRFLANSWYRPKKEG